MKRTILQKVQYLIQERDHERAMREVLQLIKPSAYANNRELMTQDTKLRHKTSSSIPTVVRPTRRCPFASSATNTASTCPTRVRIRRRKSRHGSVLLFAQAREALPLQFSLGRGVLQVHRRLCRVSFVFTSTAGYWRGNSPKSDPCATFEPTVPAGENRPQTHFDCKCAESGNPPPVAR